MSEAEGETSSYRWHDKQDYYRNELGPKIDRLQILLQQYKVACQYDDSLKQYSEALERHKEVEENNKKLKHLLYCARYNMRDREEDTPIIHGNRVTVFFRDPTRLD